ncbi:MAG TPA: mobilization protein [Acinetobacter parvus]|uniref:relaxase/mobilization nuclease domain-containing protein n=1 Tax=Acinetobacter parvus TaxID=134533 RepID=UPI002BD319B3|nr:mobilization protein [Acinetobacter parvus]HRM16281.1 mobilization protein [Acinetobacter parvus]
MHIKFLDHGKGSAAHASAYVLDKLDHLGNVRAGVDVLRGDATTFNAVCDASPHLWKYTSGVIAWSKEDEPTNEQIQEVLNEFEKHAFSGLDQSQYHLFAVLHTDDDGSKHIHVLAPRLDIQSGKSLNIAPPRHEKHFDSLRDYFNTKYQWSRPDDLLLMKTTQEPNHIAKLNAQAKNILTSQDLETLTKKQFCKTVDNYVKTLLKTQIVKNRAEIVSCIEQLEGVASVRAKQTVTVTLNNGKKHRLSGDFYHEQFEIGLYSERLRAEAESRPTASELATTLRNAENVRDDYRAKRETYHQQHYTFKRSTADNIGHKIASQSDFDRNRESITPSHKIANSELYGANRRTANAVSEYRPIGNIKSEIEHRFVFNLNSRSTDSDQQAVAEPQNRRKAPTEQYSTPSTASDSEPKRANREPVAESFDGKIKQPESISRTTWDSDIYSVDAFNQFLFRLSNKKQSENHRSTKANNSTECTSDNKPNQLLKQPTEIRHADRNRPIFDRAKQLIDATKQLVSRAKRGFESTNRFIKDHLDQLQRSRAGITGQNQHFAVGERGTTSLDLGTQRRVIQNRTGQFFAGFTAKLSKQLNEPITNAINTSLKSSELKQYCEQYGEYRTQTYSTENYSSTDRSRAGSLEALATQSVTNYRRRLRDSEQANSEARDNAWRLNSIDLKAKQLTDLIENIRLEPQPASNFINLRYDGYYPGYIDSHKILTKKQDQAYQSKNHLQLIEFISEKTDNLKKYMLRASSNIRTSDYEQIEKIIKNDDRMLKFLKCEMILKPQNEHFKSQREAYKNCLETFEDIKNLITEIKSAGPEKYISQPTPEPENKLKQSNDFELDF